MGNPIVGRQLHHFGVHHDEADLLRGGLVKQADNQGVGTHGLTGAGGTGNEYMGQFFDVADDIAAADIPPHRKGRFRGMLHKFSGFDNVPDQHRRHRFVGNLNAHHGDFIGHGGNADAAGSQRQRNIILQIGDFGELDPLIQRKFVPGDGGAVDHVPGLGIHAEAGQGLRQTAGVVPQLCPGGHVVFALAFMQQADRGITVFRLSGGHVFRDFRRHRRRLLRHRLCRRFLGSRCLRRDGRLGYRRALHRRSFLSRFRRRGDHHRLHGGNRSGRLRPADGSGHRGHRLFDGKGISLVIRLRRSLRRNHLCRGLLGVGTMPEKAGKARLVRLGGSCRCAHRVVHRDVDLRVGMLCRDRGRFPPAPCRPGRPLRLLLMFILGPLPVLFDQRSHRQPQRHHQQHHKQHGKDNDRSDLGKNRHRPLRQRAGNHAAAVQGRAVLPQRRDDPDGGGVCLLHQQHMAQAAQQHRQQQGAGHPQGNGPAVMKQENAGRQHQRRAEDPIAIPQQTFDQDGEPVDKNGTDAKVADEHAQRQHQTHHAPHFPADGAGLRLLRRRPAPGRTALFRCGSGCRFLL